MHKVSHNLKKVANRHGIPLVFSAPNKLSKLCSRVCCESRRGCRTRHEKPFVKCSRGVVYAIPLHPCGQLYIGQTERCVNDRLREHAQKINKKEDKGAHLVAHVTACGCDARFYETTILGRSGNASSRLALEAFFIKQNRERCISEPSISLLDAEFDFLRNRL